MRDLSGEHVLVRIYIGESDQWERQPLYMALLHRLKSEGFAGATVFRGIAGFGARSVLHTSSILRLSQDLPVVIEVVDSEDSVSRLKAIVDEMVRQGLVTTEKVSVLRYSPADETRRKG